MFAHFEHLEGILDDPLKWRLNAFSPGRAARLPENLAQRWEEALLYKQLATLRQDVPLQEQHGELEWQGAWERLKAICHALGEEKLPMRISRWRAGVA